ncbi:5926_t:CDS:2 [Diversispora eburnea]|uniref:5926_t:CDS:1 n=1 Tax=Diversispora eburnea TaxID=1213867 RepID=A0A9N8VNQ7_9GLOM|nr:5926_t:CDS:2 [Diversispora eburnea]
MISSIPEGANIAGDLNNLPSNFFFIDLSNIPFLDKFNDAGYPWFDLTSPNINNNIITCLGTTAVAGIPPIRRRNTQAVINNSNGKMYIFGGSTDPLFTNYNSDYPKSTFYNDMIILDTINWTWNYGSNINAPSRRNDFTAVILSSGIIIYIGGSLSNGSYVGMNQLYLFNTETNEWNAMIANGDIPDSREGASSVLTSDGKILVFGGAKKPRNNKIYDIPFSSMLAILDTTKNPYEWSIPKVRNSEPSLPPLIYHSAILVKNIMVIAFGNIINAGSSNKIYMFDTKNYEWINTKESKKRNERSKRDKIKERIEIVGKRDNNALPIPANGTSPTPIPTNITSPNITTLATPTTMDSSKSSRPLAQSPQISSSTSSTAPLISSDFPSPELPPLQQLPPLKYPPQKHIIQYQFIPNIPPPTSSTNPSTSPSYPSYSSYIDDIRHNNIPPFSSNSSNLSQNSAPIPKLHSSSITPTFEVPQQSSSSKNYLSQPPYPSHSIPIMPTFEVPSRQNSPEPPPSAQIQSTISSSSSIPDIPSHSSSPQLFSSYPSCSVPIMPTFEVPSKQNSSQSHPP